MVVFVFYRYYLVCCLYFAMNGQVHAAKQQSFIYILLNFRFSFWLKLVVSGQAHSRRHYATHDRPCNRAADSTLKKWRWPSRWLKSQTLSWRRHSKLRPAKNTTTSCCCNWKPARISISNNAMNNFTMKTGSLIWNVHVNNKKTTVLNETEIREMALVMVFEYQKSTNKRLWKNTRLRSEN